MLDAPPNILMVVALEYLDNKLFSERKKGEVRAIMAVSVGDNFNPGFDGQLHYENTEFSFRCYPCVPAMSDVPKPGFLPQAADPVGESAGVAKPPPTSLTELVHSGGSAYRKHMVVNVRVQT
jgi:hypothetical protein